MPRSTTLKSIKVSVGCQIDPSLVERMDRVIRHLVTNKNQFIASCIEDCVTLLEKDLPQEKKEVIILKGKDSSMSRFKDQPE